MMIPTLFNKRPCLKYLIEGLTDALLAKGIPVKEIVLIEDSFNGWPSVRCIATLHRLAGGPRKRVLTAQAPPFEQWDRIDWRTGQDMVNDLRNAYVNEVV